APEHESSETDPESTHAGVERTLRAAVLVSSTHAALAESGPPEGADAVRAPRDRRRDLGGRLDREHGDGPARPVLQDRGSVRLRPHLPAARLRHAAHVARVAEGPG